MRSWSAPGLAPSSESHGCAIGRKATGVLGEAGRDAAREFADPGVAGGDLIQHVLHILPQCFAGSAGQGSRDTQRPLTQMINSPGCFCLVQRMG